MDSMKVVITLDHFRRAMIDLSSLHYDDLLDIPYMDVSARLYLTAGVAVRFASKRAKCKWQAWHLDAFVADGTGQDRLGGDFTTGELRFSLDDGKAIRINYTDSASNGDAYFGDEHLFGWSA